MFGKKKCKILIVEDEEFLLKSLKEKLKEEGFSVDTANNGEDALKKLDKDTKAVVLDLIMPDMDGFYFLEEMRKMPDHKKIKVLVYTNLCQQEDIERTKKLDVDDYLIKSDNSMTEVVKKVKSICGSK